MEVLQRPIEDERKTRLINFAPTTGVGSLGCGLTMSGNTQADTRFWNLFNATPWESEHRVMVKSLHTGLVESFIDIVGRPTPWPVPRFRERELEWRRTHATELRRYENQWVVLEGESVIAHDSNAAQAIRQAKSLGIRTPYVFFVEPESDDSFKIGL